MILSNKTVICLAETRNTAELIVDQLRFHGFAIRNISVLYRDGARNRKQPHHFDYGGEGGPAEMKGVIGGVAGRNLAAGASPQFPEAGFIVAGPILECLRGGRGGIDAGVIAGALIRMGVPGVQATRYEVRLRLGGILLCVHATTPAEVLQAKFIFHSARAADLVIVERELAATVFSTSARGLTLARPGGFFHPPPDLPAKPVAASPAMGGRTESIPVR